MAIVKPLYLGANGRAVEADETQTLPATPVIRPYFDNPAENSTVAAFPVLAVNALIDLQAEKYEIKISAEITGNSAGQGKQVGFSFNAGGFEYVRDTKDVVTVDAWMLVATSFIFDNTGNLPGNVSFDFYFGVAAGNFTAKIRRKRIIAIKAVEAGI